MNTLVTGGAGFIGRWLTRRLAQRGDRVIVLDDLSTGSAERLAELVAGARGVEFVHGSVLDAELVDDARLDRPVPELAAAALTALRSVAGPGGAWHQGWVIEADAAEARQTTDALARVLGVAAGA